MEDEEDDVFEPDPNCWRTPFREIKCEDRGTQTPGPSLAPHNGMLPCGVVEEPRPLFYGKLVTCCILKEKEEQRLVCVRSGVIKLKDKVITWGSLWEMRNSVAELISPLGAWQSSLHRLLWSVCSLPSCFAIQKAPIWLKRSDKYVHLCCSDH